MAPLPSPTGFMGIAFGLALGCSTAAPVVANPDVWVKVKYLLTFSETALTGLKIDWAFDPFLSNRVITQFDADNDRAFSAEETQALKSALFDPLTDKHYFLQVISGDTAQPIRFDAIVPRIEGDQFAVTFTATPQDPIDYHRTPVAIGTYDADVFFDFTLADAEFLRVDGPFDPSCRFRVQAGEGPLRDVPQTVVLLCSE
ncbi:MAG: DUF1007 family protein [Pseudomonadota bacterium]